MFKFIEGLIPQLNTIKIGAYVLGVVVLMGIVGTLVYKYEANEKQIAILTASVASLTQSNTALTKQLQADAENAKMQEQEIAQISAVDAANNVEIAKLIQRTNAQSAAVLVERNSATTQNAFIQKVNANTSCFFSTFANGVSGSCHSGVFVPTASSPASS